MADIKVRIKEINKKYISVKGEVPALSDINLTIRKNEYISVVGPSGCGKTTLLSIISGLIPPDRGDVYINSHLVDSICPEIGYMLQEDYLFAWRTVYQNVRLGLEIKGCLSQDTQKNIMKLLDSYGLADFADHYPGELSGGMRQRVALARTLATDPEILLLDEPFSSLDYQIKLTLEEEMAKILHQQQKTVILVTHDIAEAISMADRVVVLSKRPGRIKEIFNIDFPDDLTPLQKRKVKIFQKYFDKIWGELDLDVN